MAAYVVQYTQVGDHAQGEVITYTEKQLKDGHDPARLLRIGAVREATEDEERDAVVYGQGVDAILPVPPVPFQSTAEPTDLVRAPGESAAAFKKRVAAAQDENDGENVTD